MIIVKPCHLVLPVLIPSELFDKNAVKMASSFTKVMSSRTTGLLMASLGAGAVATGYLMSDNAAVSADQRRKL